MNIIVKLSGHGESQVANVYSDGSFVGWAHINRLRRPLGDRLQGPSGWSDDLKLWFEIATAPGGPLPGRGDTLITLMNQAAKWWKYEPKKETP